MYTLLQGLAANAASVLLLSTIRAAYALRFCPAALDCACYCPAAAAGLPRSPGFNLRTEPSIGELTRDLSGLGLSSLSQRLRARSDLSDVGAGGGPASRAQPPPTASTLNAFFAQHSAPVRPLYLYTNLYPINRYPLYYTLYPHSESSPGLIFRKSTQHKGAPGR